MDAPKVVIVGAGPAGTRSALTLASCGIIPTLIDEAPSNGGQIYRRRPGELRSDDNPYGFEARRAANLHRDFDLARQAIDFRGNTTVWDVKPGVIHAVTNGKPAKIHWDRLIIATGAMDRVIPFRGWTLPGVYTLGAAQTTLKGQRCAIGSRPVFFGTGPLLYLVAYQYAKAGINVQAVLDTSSFRNKVKATAGLLFGGKALLKGIYYLAALKARGVAIHSGISNFGVHGENALNEVFWTDARGNERSLACDAVATGFNLVSQTQIADLCELPFEFNSLQQQWLPTIDDAGRSAVANIYLAGDGAVIGGADVAELSGERAALALLEDAGLLSSRKRIKSINRKLRGWNRFRQALDGNAFPFPDPVARQIPDDVVVCRCEGIDAATIRNAVHILGADEINRTKAFSRLGMGRCQGRVCGSAAAQIIAEAAKCRLQDVSRIRSQAPIKPVPLSILAGESLE